MSDTPYNPNDLLMVMRVQNRLIECGVCGSMNAESIDKLRRGAVLVIDQRGKQMGEIGWLKQLPNGKQIWQPARPIS